MQEAKPELVRKIEEARFRGELAVAAEKAAAEKRRQQREIDDENENTSARMNRKEWENWDIHQR